MRQKYLLFFSLVLKGAKTLGQSKIEHSIILLKKCAACVNQKKFSFNFNFRAKKPKWYKAYKINSAQSCSNTYAYIHLIHVSNICMKWNLLFFSWISEKKSIKNALLSSNQSRNQRENKTIWMVHIFVQFHTFKRAERVRCKLYLLLPHCAVYIKWILKWIFFLSHKHNMILWSHV